MVKKNIFSAIALILTSLCASAQMTFSIEGPESRYNQIRVVNKTSQTDFKCRIIILNEDGSDSNKIYGIYELKEKGDSDSNTEMIERGTKLKIQKPKNFPVELDFKVEYKDYPFFDAVIIHLFDKGSTEAFEEEFE